MAERVPGGRRLFGPALAIVAAVALAAGPARAEDGVAGFFQQLFGGDGRPSAQPLPQPDFGGSSPPLTVRARKHRRPSGARVARAPRYSPEELKSVTIYTDKTLVRGDAVMTAQGVRVFNGSPAWPHTEEDFVAVSLSDKLPKTVRVELNAIDAASRSDFRGR